MNELLDYTIKSHEVILLEFTVVNFKYNFPIYSRVCYNAISIFVLGNAFSLVLREKEKQCYYFIIRSQLKIRSELSSQAHWSASKRQE